MKKNTQPEENERSKMRVALYVRVSTEDQAKEGFSLPAQLSRLHKFSEAQDWQVMGEFADEGHSGRNTRRPAYKRMMEQRDTWDMILVLKMDRIHRNLRNFTNMMDELKREGKDFASVMESLDTSTALGRFFMDMTQRMAQLESEQIAERVTIGMEQKAQQQLGVALGALPYGYRVEAEGRIAVVEKEARVVRRIFALAETMSANRIAKRLTAEGVTVPHPDSKRWSGHRPDGVPVEPALRRWNGGTVRRILTNRFYLGERRWAQVVVPNNHPAIIDEVSMLKAKQTLEAFGVIYRPDCRVEVPVLDPKPVWTPANAEEANAIPHPHRTEDGRGVYGYRIVEGGQWVVEPGAALLMQKIYAQAAAGITTYAIARDLNAQGIPSPRGGRWEHAAIRMMLNNRNYLGERQAYGKTIPNHHAPLVTPEVFMAAQKRPGHRRKAQLAQGIPPTTPEPTDAGVSA